MKLYCKFNSACGRAQWRSCLQGWGCLALLRQTLGEWQWQPLPSLEALGVTGCGCPCSCTGLFWMQPCTFLCARRGCQHRGSGQPGAARVGSRAQQGLQSFSPEGAETRFVLLPQWKGEVVGSQVRVSSAACTHPAVKQLMIGCLSILSVSRVYSAFLAFLKLSVTRALRCCLFARVVTALFTLASPPRFGGSNAQSRTALLSGAVSPSWVCRAGSQIQRTGLSGEEGVTAVEAKPARFPDSREAAGTQERSLITFKMEHWTVPLALLKCCWDVCYLDRMMLFGCYFKYKNRHLICVHSTCKLQIFFKDKNVSKANIMIKTL